MMNRAITDLDRVLARVCEWCPAPSAATPGKSRMVLPGGLSKGWKGISVRSVVPTPGCTVARPTKNSPE